MVMIIQPDRLTRGVAHTPLLSHNPLRGRAAKRWNPMQTLAVLNFICPIETRNYIFSHDQMMRPWCVAPGPAAMCKITLYEMHFAALGGGHCGGGVGCSCSDKFAYVERILSAAPGQTHTHKERERYVERDVHSCNPFLGSGSAENITPEWATSFCTVASSPPVITVILWASWREQTVSSNTNTARFH